MSAQMHTLSGARKANDVVRARVNADLKREATEILAAIGLTPSDAYRMLLMRIVAERSLPFDPLVPNQTTIDAMNAKPDSGTFETVDELFEELNAQN